VKLSKVIRFAASLLDQVFLGREWHSGRKAWVSIGQPARAFHSLQSTMLHRPRTRSVRYMSA
jgi:hypothetical protein